MPLSLIHDAVGGLGCLMVQNMFELWLNLIVGFGGDGSGSGGARGHSGLVLVDMG